MKLREVSCIGFVIFFSIVTIVSWFDIVNRAEKTEKIEHKINVLEKDFDLLLKYESLYIEEEGRYRYDSFKVFKKERIIKIDK